MISVPWPVARVETERRRLEVLAYLASIPTYEAAAMILRDQCRAVGIPTTSDQIVACIAWLNEHELVTCRTHRDEPIARLTGTGRDVALGHQRHPGVMQPDP